MTEEEFSVEARRILIAFDFQFDGEIRIRKHRARRFHHYDGFVYGFDLVTEHINISFGILEPLNSWSFMLSKFGSTLECDEWPIDPIIYAEEGNPSQFAPLMARGMFRLGYDISLIETEFDLTITAHEKLEWQLQFQRRLREGTLSKVN